MNHKFFTFDFVKRVSEFEGFSSKAYLCPSGKLTIGYGHTSDVYPHMVVTKSQALKFLFHDLRDCFEQLSSSYDCSGWPVGMVQCYVDFVFNCGIGTLRRSSMHTLLKSFSSLDDVEKPSCALQLTNILRKYCCSRGRKLKGLVRRRAYEESLFLNSYSIILS